MTKLDWKVLCPRCQRPNSNRQIACGNCGHKEIFAEVHRSGNSLISRGTTGTSFRCRRCQDFQLITCEGCGAKLSNFIGEHFSKRWFL